ncbi:glycosyltransferase [Acinetobacter nosocomialis]|uniref:glycosyltransferase n=1 Tax=Acinetobacter nosocomialis TaxID=106654 RepID=UPI001B82F18A|nr:glycosyltransferase [Acinetobacter nosocomialis]MBR7682431.1 glycosyltransferase [Acinetobacter nosocomialis]MCZ3087464.1 glycosyltransferase [Acinetobacter baumannii]
MRILYVITGLGGGGAEKVVCDLADEMCALGHVVKIAYLKGEVIVFPKNKNIELINLGLESVVNTFGCFRNYRDLLIRFMPHVVHSHMVHANIFTRISRNFYSIPKLISTAHSSNEGGNLRMWAYKFTHNLSDLTTNVSLEASRNFEIRKGVPRGEIKTIYNGIDLKKFIKNPLIKDSLRNDLNIKKDIPIFIAVGRFHDAKDYPNLINAFKIFKKRLINNNSSNIPILLIVGDGELKSEIEFLIESSNLSNSIKLLGRRNDIPDLLNLADYFILSSKYEGLPTVIMEAMACETFVISTNCSGSEEIMGDTGIRVPISDSATLAEGLLKAFNLSSNEIELNNLYARERIEKIFSLEKSIETWLEIYES